MIEGRITGRDFCRQEYYKASCETGISHYLPHCKAVQVVVIADSEALKND